ncbi:MAG TPA: hypothetical protein VE715_22320 [Blastocatellia bacterium]|nr:hypothetical protein [Blastocatellia bacterium]
MSKPPDTSLTRKEYEEFIYTIRENYPTIEASTLVVIMIASESAEVSGEIFFADDIRLEVTEVLDFSEKRIEGYGYTVYCGEEKLYWYDSTSPE